MKHRPGGAPDHNQHTAADEGDGMAGGSGNPIGDMAEKTGNLHIIRSSCP
jgi:hypothetical protein